ncbi:MAG: response regulator [Flexilinea sp.]|nr:response regulator [Flexilinea sp.]
MADWIIIVDDDISSLRIAENILIKAGKRVTTLKSGRALLEYVRENGYPDLILMDTNIPDLDGFETLRLLKRGMIPGKEAPVIFLTAEDQQSLETRGLESGAMDFIHKPFHPNVLVSRVQKILDIQKRILKYERDAETDPLTGLLNKTAAEEKISARCREESGFVCLLDLDSFKSINDIFGHDIGDRVLIMFAHILRKYTTENDEIGRIGGDEFILFSPEISSEEKLSEFTQKINEEYVTEAKKLMGDHQPIPLGISIGAVPSTEFGSNYEKLFHIADQALYFVKQNGKHGCKLFTNRDTLNWDVHRVMDLDTITSILEERNESPNAMWMGNEVFGSIYRYMVRYMGRYHSSAYRVLFTVKPIVPISAAENTEIMMQFRKMMQTSLRNSDVMMECGEHQLFLLLPEIQEFDVDRVLSRLLKKWKESAYSEKVEITYEAGQVHLKKQQDQESKENDRPSVIVVDEDESVLRMAADTLGKHNMNVTVANSGLVLLELVKIQKPDLILLDISLPEYDGIDLLHQLRMSIDQDRELPVIMMMDNGDPVLASQCLALGAIDFIRKPFQPEILYLRANHAIELVRLQRNMAEAVQRKSMEMQKISLHVVHTLAETIDAKDRYTNGHSTRVADLSREIGRRSGYTIKQQEEIYMMALLHDIGKIGIPDAVINKAGKLTAEEYDVIKTHPSVGGKILRNIEEMPSLYTGARWHHERYDGYGYPDGLSGREIPEEARIIAVADAYDAMTSRRSYRDALSQEAVRAEIERCSGTQFDPKFAEIMLNMIDEDPNYEMREQ